jgi:hypothetical protein
MANSSASVFIKPTVSFNRGDTFVFRCWVCTADGAGSFQHRLTMTPNPKTELMSLPEVIAGTLAGKFGENSLYNQWASRLEEARCDALVQLARCPKGIRRYHDHNIKEHSFNVDNLVLRRIQNTEGLHKLSSTWEGPFSISKVTGPGSYHLQTLEGDDISNSWNVDQLCRFYA